MRNELLASVESFLKNRLKRIIGIWIELLEIRHICIHIVVLILSHLENGIFGIAKILVLLVQSK